MPPDRACECGDAAKCTGEHAERARGIRVGTRYEYECPRCKKTFRVHSSGSLAFSVFAALVLSGAGWLVVTNPPGAAVGAESSNRWFGWILSGFGAAAWVIFSARVLARQKHPARPG